MAATTAPDDGNDFISPNPSIYRQFGPQSLADAQNAYVHGWIGPQTFEDHLQQVEAATGPEEDGEFELTPGTPLYDIVERRVRNNQDLTIIVSDYHNRRGTGKTILTLKLMAAIQRLARRIEPVEGAEPGISKAQTDIRAEPIIDAYTDQPLRTALGLDEAEVGLSKYDAGSQVNRTVRELVSMGRIEEKYVVLNLPASAELDRDLKALCDLWVLVQRKGQALVHTLPYQPYHSKELTKKIQTIEWSDIRGTHEIRHVYRSLTEKKRAHLRGEGQESFIPASEVDRIVDQKVAEAEREQRDELLRAFFHGSEDLTRKDVYDAVESTVDLSYERVREIINEES